MLSQEDMGSYVQLNFFIKYLNFCKKLNIFVKYICRKKSIGLCAGVLLGIQS